MLTTAITGAIGATMAAMGIPPGPYLAVVWVAVKVAVVAGIMGAGALGLKAKKRLEAPSEKA